jgi:hypothetical protein
MTNQNNLPQRISLQLQSSYPLDSRAPIEVGVPVPQGQAVSLQQLQLQCNGHIISCAAQPLNYWHDKSIKWINLIFFVKPEAGENYELVINQAAKAITASTSGLVCIDTQDCLTIQNANFTFELQRDRFEFSLTSPKEGVTSVTSALNSISLFDPENNLLAGHIVDVHTNKFHDLADGSVRVIKLRITGYHGTDKASGLAEFDTDVTFYYQQGCIKLAYTLRNSKAALHSGGNWDLGDPHSLYFSALNFDMALGQSGDIRYQPEPGENWQDVEHADISLQQLSSGGENWQSPIHWDHKQQIPFSQQGYQVLRNNVNIAQAKRATPSVFVQDCFGLTLENFWQNFPKSISIQGENISLGLFPQQAGIQYELQGGEQKTHTLWLNAAGDQEGLAWVHQKPNVILPRQIYQQSDHFLYLNKHSADAPLRALILNALDSDSNFYRKREIVDQYGWRNFGDLYADHETADYQGHDIFVSHYNNQYDPIFGFLRQYMIDGDNRWFELADDLAKHVTDIDIYHTTQDKIEYNGGLFWHTDHYLQAFTSSHRSYSKYQASDAYQDHAGGGGPGGQHCYTSGLMLHYLMTGNQNSKQAVLTLTDWITHVYEGSSTCLELLLALKNRHVAGFKNHFTGQYPLDRGTANYIFALLDSHELTQQAQYLHRVEHIVHNTMHPDEDLTPRQLHDVETTWFYTVLLQALTRYLHVKESVEQFDNHFYYARDCLLNFADWMVNNEYLYLDKPDILEYPNDTWTAQDLRKAQIFAAAGYFSHDARPEYRQKAQYFELEVHKRLAVSKTKTYTRIMVLIMQNYGATDYYHSVPATNKFSPRKQGWPVASYQTISFAKGLVKTLAKRLRKLSISHEIDWLKKRLG